MEQKLGRYTIEEPLGEGSFAWVYRAFDQKLKRYVALKVLKPMWLDDSSAMRRFEREATTMANLHHPHIAEIYDVDESEGQVYLAQFLVEGETLAKRLTRGALSWAEMLAILKGVAAALDYAHGQGIIHRDLKPANILLARDGRPYLSDFGLVRAAEGSVAISSSSGGMVGTASYMAPEQWRGQAASPATDVYALACVAVEMLTGKRLFDAPSSAAVMTKHVMDPPEFPAQWPPDVPEGVTKVLQRGLAKDPAERISRASELAVEMEALSTASQLAVPAPASVSPPAPQPPAQRRSSEGLLAGGAIALVGGAVMLVVIVGAILFFVFGGGNAATVVKLTNTPRPTPEFTDTPTVTPTPETPTSTVPGSPALVTQTDLNVRAGPGTNYALLGLFPTGTTAEIIGRDESRQWWQVRFPPAPDGIGWVSTDPSFSKVSNAENVPVAQNPPTPTPTPTDTPTPVSLPQTITAPDGATMVLVPAGPFEMGNDADVGLAECKNLYFKPDDECERGWLEDEEPKHTVTLDDFYIDQYEVTNAQYAACVDDGVCDLPSDTGSDTRESYYGNSEYDDYPVIYVNWEQAKTYCEWRGARLPTEAEWEKAARGTDGRQYPWGDTFDGARTNFCDRNCAVDWANVDYDDGYADTAPVGSYSKGGSPYGVYDMAGNVWEWVADWYDKNYYSSSPAVNPTGPSSGEFRVIRGGAWNYYGSVVRAAARLRDLPTGMYVNIGFRCARSPEKPTASEALPEEMPAVTETPVAETPTDTEASVEEELAATEAPLAELPQIITAPDGATMILIPTGPFEMGDDADVGLAECKKLHTNPDECKRSWFEDEEPKYTVTLDDFYIDQYEVTNAQ